MIIELQRVTRDYSSCIKKLCLATVTEAGLQISSCIMRFEVLTEIKITMLFFWVMT